MILGLLVLLLVHLLLYCFLGAACPPENLIRPCVCNHNSILCSYITEQSVLDGIFRRLGNMHVDQFLIKNSQIDHLTSSALENNFFQKIRIKDSVLTDLFDRNPSSQNVVSLLSLQNVTILNGFRVECLQPLIRLEYLMIALTQISRLGKEFNMYLSQKIKGVGLFVTNTSSIDDAFAGKPDLEVIHVQNASLTSIDRLSFPHPAKNLKILTFNGNQIERLDKDQFTLMNSLRFVSFADNKISQVSEEVFGEIYDQLEALDLSGNPVNCDCSIKWITEKNVRRKIVRGECVKPRAFAGKNIADLKSSDFVSCTREISDK